jgi:regulator of protease activity HflC (stomatin/prohibitin superfamily)
MDSAIVNELGTLAVITVVVATFLGLWGSGFIGTLFLGLSAGVSCLFCYIGFGLYGVAGLLVGVVLGALVVGILGRLLGKRRGSRFLAFLWLGFCAACGAGYWAAGWLGWLTITLPSLVLFVYSLWRFSGRLLPIERRSWFLVRDVWRHVAGPEIDRDSERNIQHRYRSFRALLTHSLGTNYPYYVVEGGDRLERVGGDPIWRFFAGPGIVLTNPHEVAVVTDGMEIKEIAPPGLAFTGRLDRVDQIVDLRTQLKTTNVSALTKDGIRVQVLAYVFFRIDATSGDADRFWAGDQTGAAVFEIVRLQQAEGEERQVWDGLPARRARFILQDIIGEYEFDELCARDVPSWHDPKEIVYEVIKKELARRLKEAMKEECRGLEIVGAGIANLEPADPKAMQQRIENWRTEWTRRMAIQLGQGERAALQQVAQARALAQAKVIRILTSEVEDLEDVDRDVLADVLTLRLLEELDDMARSPSVRELLSPETEETMQKLRRAAAAGDPSMHRGRGK